MSGKSTPEAPKLPPLPPAAPVRAPSASIAESAELDRWFDSIHPPVPSLPEIAVEVSPEVTPARARRRRIARNFVIACVSGGACLVVAALVVRSQSAKAAHASAFADPALALASEATDRSSAATPGARVGPATGATAATALPAPGGASLLPKQAASATPASDSSAAKTGELRLPSAAAGHRVFVDGHSVTGSSSSVHVACGHHTVRIGTWGKQRTVEVPCGGSVSVSP